jgi:hypothetical protein
LLTTKPPGRRTARVGFKTELLAVIYSFSTASLAL